jgi:hypothetical protein
MKFVGDIWDEEDYVEEEDDIINCGLTNDFTIFQFREFIKEAM